MPTTTFQLRANRVNALCSTGPRTPSGLARTAQNALKVGLFSRLLVIPTLGETAEEFDLFRSSIVLDIRPSGALEAELADRVALLLWRLRRVMRYETAAMITTIGSLPPHPDDVLPLTGSELGFRDPPNAPLTHRLARLRAALAGASGYLAARQFEATVLDPERNPEEPIDGGTACRVLWGGGDELGWVPRPDPWPPVLAGVGLGNREILAVKGTIARIYLVLNAVADGAGCDRGEFLEAVRRRLRKVVIEYERSSAGWREEEIRLAADLLRERTTAAAAQLYADDALVQRVARAESHLSHQLDKALTLLAERQADRRSDESAAPMEFVLRQGVSD